MSPVWRASENTPPSSDAAIPSFVMCQLLSRDPRSWVQATPDFRLVNNQRPNLAITATVMTSAVINVNCPATDQRLRRSRYQFFMNAPTIATRNLQYVHQTMVPCQATFLCTNANKMSVLALLR